MFHILKDFLIIHLFILNPLKIFIHIQQSINFNYFCYYFSSWDPFFLNSFIISQ